MTILLISIILPWKYFLFFEWTKFWLWLECLRGYSYKIKIFFLIQRRKKTLFCSDVMWSVYKYTHVNILLTRVYFLAAFFCRCAQYFNFLDRQVKSDNRITHFSFSFFLLPTCVIVVLFWYFVFVFIIYWVYVSVYFCLRVYIGQILDSFSFIGLYYAINFPNQEIFSLSLDW